MEEKLKVEDKDTAPKRRRVLDLEPVILWEQTRDVSYWNRLPYPLTVQVYRLLNTKDRKAMSQVCQAWRKTFKDPSLWRTREFTLGGTYSKQRGRNVLRFASMFGSGLQEVVIRCQHRTSNTCKQITETMENLLEKLANSRLRRLELLDLLLDRFVQFPELKDNVCACLVKMFKTQTELKRVVMQTCQFHFWPGTEVLNSLLESSGQTLDSLHLYDYFQTSDFVFEANTFLDIITKFNNVREISVNYSYISEELFQLWAVSLKAKLKRIKIKVSGSEPHAHIITTRTWTKLNKACSELKVELLICDLSHANTIIPILSPGMPLTAFFMNSDMESAHDNQLGSTLTYIADTFEKKLESFGLALDHIQDSVDNEIISVIRRCTKLTFFYLPNNAIVSVFTGLRVRNIRLYPGRFDNIPNGQQLLKNFHDLLKKVPNLTVEWVNEE